MVLFLTLAVPISVHAEDKIPCYIFPVMGATVIESGEKMNTINVMPGTTEVTKNTCYGTNVEENATIRSVIENAFNVMGWQNFDENSYDIVICDMAPSGEYSSYSLTDLDKTVNEIYPDYKKEYVEPKVITNGVIVAITDSDGNVTNILQDEYDKQQQEEREKREEEQRRIYQEECNFQNDAQSTMTNAVSGTTAVIDSGTRHTFTRDTIDVIKNCKANVELQYKIAGVDYKTIIPAGLDLAPFADNDGYIGFLKINDICNTYWDAHNRYQELYSQHGSFNGNCGSYTFRQMKLSGIIGKGSKNESTMLGKNYYNLYKGKVENGITTTSGGYNIEAYGGSNGLQDLLNAHLGEDLHNIIISYNPSKIYGSKENPEAGHVMFVNRIVNGVVFFTESNRWYDKANRVWHGDGEVTAMPVDEFLHDYPGANGTVYFSK